MGQSSCSGVRSPYLAGDQFFLLRPEHHRAPAETVGRATNADRIVKSAEARSELMKHVRSYANVTRRWYRPIEHECPECHRTLRQALTLSKRTAITLEGGIKLIHAGDRWPDGHCRGHQRTYASTQAVQLL